MAYIRSLQVTEVCRMTGMVCRKFYGYISSDAFLLLYLTWVHPHLEYAAVVWDPHQLVLNVVYEPQHSAAVWER